jgi:RNA polymerase sigma-19 factor, ECF subfamily
MNGSQLDYQELLMQLKNDDQHALRRLYEATGDKLFQFSLSIVYIREVAQEVVQDVFLQIWKNRSQIDTGANFKLYLFVATRNMSITHLRRNNRHKMFSLDEIKLPFLKIEPTAEDNMVTSELLHRINLAINNLPQQCKLIFKLTRNDGFKYREVAELLQISQKTVENQVAIALKKLHAALPVRNKGNHSSTG